MPYFIHELPYLDTRDINLDWIFKKQRSLEETVEALDEKLDELEEQISHITEPVTLVKVEDYGATGDGVTDDTAAIQQCITENPCATIFFKKGNYKITDTIYLYDEWGGQQVIFGGARFFWDGPMDYTKPMISITLETEHLPEYGSACRVLGGNFDALHRVGYCCEQYGFYTILDGCKFINFLTCGLFVGKIDGQYTAGKSSLQAKHNNLMIYHNEGNFSADDTTAVIIDRPDCEYNQVITNRTRVAFELRAGGNSFVNCHSTIQFANPASVTPEQYLPTKNIYVNPTSSGSTQQNTFQGCYFNMGHYVVYSEIQSRFCVNLDSCYYIWYTSADFAGLYDADDADSYIQVILCGGKASDFRCNNIDILVGARCSVLDYFPQTTPSLIPLPDMVKINSNDRHTEAPVWSAWNLQPENTLTPLCSASNPAEIDTYYEVGAILLCYNGTATTMPSTSPVKVRAYEGAGVAEWTVGFESDQLTPPRLHPVILDWHCTTDFNTMLFFIEPDPEDINIEGIIYPCYKIYMQINGYGGQPRFCTIENDSPFMKCYIRAQVNEARVRDDGTGLIQLNPYGKALLPILLREQHTSSPITVNPGAAELTLSSRVQDILDVKDKIIEDIVYEITGNTYDLSLLARFFNSVGKYVVKRKNIIYMITTAGNLYNILNNPSQTYQAGIINIASNTRTVASDTIIYWYLSPIFKMQS